MYTGEIKKENTINLSMNVNIPYTTSSYKPNMHGSESVTANKRPDVICNNWVT